MPLIVVCGVPLCGKTSRANEIVSKLRSRPEFDNHWPGGIHLINDANSGVSYAGWAYLLFIIIKINYAAYLYHL